VRMEVFTPDWADEVRQFVLGVLEGEGFGYDPAKDFDLEDICGYYIDNGGVFVSASNLMVNHFFRC